MPKPPVPRRSRISQGPQVSACSAGGRLMAGPAPLRGTYASGSGASARPSRGRARPALGPLGPPRRGAAESRSPWPRYRVESGARDERREQLVGCVSKIKELPSSSRSISKICQSGTHHLLFPPHRPSRSAILALHRVWLFLPSGLAGVTYFNTTAKTHNSTGVETALQDLPELQ